MITRIELENFKGVRERVSLDLKPITLLFGANSSGKSTVIHALHYALEVLKNHNLDADRTTLGGEAIDLGGFRNLVHGHDLDRRIRLLFEFDVDGSLPDHTAGFSDMSPEYRAPPGPNLEGADLEDRLSTAWVRVEIAWSLPLQKPQVFSYEVGTNGNRDRPTVRIEGGAGKGQTATLVVQANDAVWGASQGPEDILELEYLVDDAGIKLKAGVAALPVYGQESALPRWGRPLRLWLADDMERISPSLVQLRQRLSKLAVGAGELLVAELERILYVGPLRTVPPRNYRPPLTEDLARWADGLGAWDALLQPARAALVLQVSKWMQRLETGYRLERHQVRDVAEASLRQVATALGDFEVLQEIRRELAPPADSRGGGARHGTGTRTSGLLNSDWVDLLISCLEALPGAQRALEAGRPREELVLVDERNGVHVHPPDVGVGISQLLPVIVAALFRGSRGAGAFVVLEQPELHIHPKLQVALADLFIEQSTAGSVSDHRFLLETHSEHLLLRLLRRIREGRNVGAAAPEAASSRLASSRVKRARTEKGTRAAKNEVLPKAGRPVRVPDTRERIADEEAVSPGPRITPETLSVIYVQRQTDGGVSFTPLRVDENGEFLDIWPEGFFGERLQELY